MSFDITPEPVVRAPKDKRPRIGRGFSQKEIEAADLTIPETRDMGLIVDLRRRTLHEENVEALKNYVAEIDDIIEAMSLEEPATDVATAIDELSSIRGVSKANAETLAGAGILTISDLAYCDIEKTANKTGIDEDKITSMVKAALKKV
jgi:large subunit ribosomal protein L13e